MGRSEEPRANLATRRVNPRNFVNQRPGDWGYSASFPDTYDCAITAGFYFDGEYRRLLFDVLRPADL